MDKLSGSGGADGMQKLAEVVRKHLELCLAALERTVSEAQEKRRQAIGAAFGSAMVEAVDAPGGLGHQLMRFAEETEGRLAKVERQSGITPPPVDPAAIRARVNKHLEDLRGDLQKIAARLAEPAPTRTFGPRDLGLIHAAAVRLALEPATRHVDAFSLSAALKGELAGDLRKGVALTRASVEGAVMVVRRKVTAGEV